jgi:halimadienyl-diphosphate synthase
MMNTAYDTAWVARLAELDEPIGEQALEWLRAHQLPDGSWGASELRYYHDRLICTLAGMTALARQGRSRDRTRWERAQLALETATKGLGADPAGNTIGFEMIVPTLLAEAEALGLIQRQHNGFLGRLAHYRAAKLAALPDGMINRFVTVAFSAEMAGPDGLQLLDLKNLQEADGSIGHSPSATAYFALHVRRQNPAALQYLREVTFNGSAPNVAPFDVFERAWVLWNLALTGPLDDETLALCQPHLDFLQKEWEPGQGVCWASAHEPKDGDDTAVTHEVLTRFGRSVDLEALLHYERDDHFYCFPLEANPSISAHIHILSALRQAGLKVEHPSVTKILQFLYRSQTLKLFWFDKWHASPYYSTAYAIIACAGYVDWLVDDAAYWILETQNPDGSWGYYMPTAEETAYCLQALVFWKRHGGQVPDEVLKRGAAWLADHAEPPYPPLWIGKCLYCPVLVVRSAILSALMLIAQE